ncbi:lipocalin family protein [Capnocytophaga canimorsus]|uniref:lipocalin family protein n=1 Tax=Capnocytophaga canimorsus TaxID=28188 RepID=UPI0037D94E5E
MNKLTVFIFVLLLGCQKWPSVQKTDLLGVWQLEAIRVGGKAINLSGKPMDLGNCLSQATLTFKENNVKITAYPTAYDCEDSEVIENELPYEIKKNEIILAGKKVHKIIKGKLVMETQRDGLTYLTIYKKVSS